MRILHLTMSLFERSMNFRPNISDLYWSWYTRVVCTKSRRSKLRYPICVGSVVHWLMKWDSNVFLRRESQDSSWMNWLKWRHTNGSCNLSHLPNGFPSIFPLQSTSMRQFAISANKIINKKRKKRMSIYLSTAKYRQIASASQHVYRWIKDLDQSKRDSVEGWRRNLIIKFRLKLMFQFDRYPMKSLHRKTRFLLRFILLCFLFALFLFCFVSKVKMNSKYS